MNGETQEVKRAKPGRKPGSDNKIPLTIYVEKSRVEKAGKGNLIYGKEIIKTEMNNFVLENFDKPE